MDNLSEINQNFDTIKTLLNSIRAQGILNTSDVDKLLSGINSKLEKINTEEDIDLIKIFLSELKQNLDERHGVLVSKFGAIESLFSNLLKNSSEMPKSSDIKELFDIVATNLSVFSREVVSQKETLTDITLRIDALRSDDSQKKEIIKNIALLKPDLERLNNGFDSIVISLNENFKTIVKTLSTVDKSEYFDKFANDLKNIEMSSNTLLSALQMLDKKADQVDVTLRDLATKDDIESAKKRLFELTVQSQELSAMVTDVSERYVRIDNLADKVDASVSIIAGLKGVLEEADEKQTGMLLEQLRGLESKLNDISSDTKFEDFKLSLEEVLKNIIDSSEVLNVNILSSSQEIRKIVELLEALDIKVGFQNLLSEISKVEESVKNSIREVAQSINTLSDANITRVLNDISSGADLLTAKLNQSQSEIGVLCEKNFNSLFENILDLKKVISQIDENSISANNAIFSSITDRLTIFENSLSTSLELQEKTVNNSSAQLIEQVENIKNLSGVLDYKLDSSLIEVGNMKQEFSNIKTSVDSLLAIDFVNLIKDLRVDLYASKQDLVKSFNETNSSLSENLTKELHAKYELLVSKLVSVENEFKKTQEDSLTVLQGLLKNISDSIIDVISYVSESKNLNSDTLDSKISELAESFKENSLNYVDTVRDIVDVIKLQVDTNLKAFEEENTRTISSIKDTVSESSEEIRKEIKYSYAKLIEIQDIYNEIKETINVNNENSLNKMQDVLCAAETTREEFDSKLASLKSALLDNITDFKQEFTCENADKISELKFSVESLYKKIVQDVSLSLENIDKNIQTVSSEDKALKEEYCNSILSAISDTSGLLKNLNAETRTLFIDKLDSMLKNYSELSLLLSNSAQGTIDLVTDKNTELINSIETLKETLSNTIFSVNADTKELVTEKAELIQKEFVSLKESFALVNDATKGLVEEKADALLNNFVDLREFIRTLDLEANNLLKEQVDAIIQDFSSIKSILEKVDENIDGDMTRQLSIIESNFESLVSQITILFDKSDSALSEKLTNEFSNLSSDIKDLMSEKLLVYCEKIEQGFETLKEKNSEQSKYLQERIVDLNSMLKDISAEQAEENNRQLEEIASQLRSVIDENIKLTAVDYVALKNKVNEFAKNIESNNNLLVQELKAQIDDVTKYVDSGIELQAQNYNSKQDDLIERLNKGFENINNIEEKMSALDSSFASNQELLVNKISEISLSEIQELNVCVDKILDQINTQKQLLQTSKDFIAESMQKEVVQVAKNIEKETDVIIGELIEQFELLKKSQADDIINLSSRVEEIVAGQIYSSVDDLKSYLDIKTDNSVFESKIDNFKIEIVDSLQTILGNITKLLDVELFKTSINDFRAANEVVLNSGLETLNDKMDEFVSSNCKFLEEKFSLFDKKFIEAVADKYEEIKLLANTYNESISVAEKNIVNLLTNFDSAKIAISSQIESLAEMVRQSLDSTNDEVRALQQSFENLRSQISNKSFDEAFQASIEKQIAGLESLVSEQLKYVQEVSNLCVNNLPDISDLTSTIKLSVVDSVNKFSQKLDSYNVENSLNQMKSDLVTQFINVFNQLSFVAEQEEIVEYIQEKHEELISILSHIVTSSEDVSDIKTTVSAVDEKIDSLRGDIEQLNEKITAVISADGDVDYVYSLHDLESDIANLRLALNEMKENNRGQEFAELISSTNEIYNLVESIKQDLPAKIDYETLAEDIESISSRTNKLLLTSDESYKTLQDNLQDFKLVINDLDERTRNFAQESGMDKIDSKLNAINTMMINGAKTNQVFNQVFEYLAQWVDGASSQINAISDKVETLDDIGQIKVMLADLKAEAEDNSESVELIEALGTVFDKQTKRISSLESKLDKIIVETTINNKNNKLDLGPIEETLNRFLVAMDEKLSSQQQKIDSLESKLSETLSLLDEKETAQLTKKVGGMDRQIAKLNKSIEKIASHVIEN